MTPGEKAHAAWKAAMDALGDAVPTWEEVSEFPAEVAAWEAAAKANPCEWCENVRKRRAECDAEWYAMEARAKAEADARQAESDASIEELTHYGH